MQLEYEKAAEAYLRSLPPEHFMESTPQATQREITVESFALIKPRRPDFQSFNELLVQYLFGKPPVIRQVVPDNMVVLHTERIKAKGSFNVPLQPVGPFWAMEYVSKDSERKDYDENFLKYEQELKVPYYLAFHPDNQELSLFRRGKARYASVKPNALGRCALPELELEVAILDEWVRFWWRGELLPLPADLERELVEARRELEEERRQKQGAVRALEEERRQKQEVVGQLEAAQREIARMQALLKERKRSGR